MKSISSLISERTACNILFMLSCIICIAVLRSITISIHVWSSNLRKWKRIQARYSNFLLNENKVVPSKWSRSFPRNWNRVTKTSVVVERDDRRDDTNELVTPCRKFKVELEVVSNAEVAKARRKSGARKVTLSTVLPGHRPVVSAFLFRPHGISAAGLGSLREV